MMLNNLQKLGFSENEARVYLALLEAGFGTTAPIIKKTNLHRNIVYETLDRLVNRGLASFSIQRGKKHFRALSPLKILQQQETQLRLAQEVAPILIKMQKAEKQEVIIYEGKEGFQNAHFDAIGQMKNSSAVYVMIAGGEKWFEVMGSGLKKFDSLRVAKKIKDKIIALESQRKDITLQGKRPLFEARFLPEYFDNPSGTSVYGDITLIMVYGEPPLTIMIKNAQVAKGFKQYFDILWKMAKE